MQENKLILATKSPRVLMLSGRKVKSKWKSFEMPSLEVLSGVGNQSFAVYREEKKKECWPGKMLYSTNGSAFYSDCYDVGVTENTDGILTSVANWDRWWRCIVQNSTEKTKDKWRRKTNRGIDSHRCWLATKLGIFLDTSAKSRLEKRLKLPCGSRTPSDVAALQNDAR